MKRLFSIILSVAVASVFTACKDDYDGWIPENPDKPHITEIISPTDIKIEAAGTPQTVTVALNDDWTITNIPFWLTVSPTSGKAGEKVTVNISAESNTKSVSERGVQLYVSTKFNTQYIGVTQFGVPESPLPQFRCNGRPADFQAVPPLRLGNHKHPDMAPLLDNKRLCRAGIHHHCDCRRKQHDKFTHSDMPTLPRQFKPVRDSFGKTGCALSKNQRRGILKQFQLLLEHRHREGDNHFIR